MKTIEMWDQGQLGGVGRGWNKLEGGKLLFWPREQNCRSKIKFLTLFLIDGNKKCLWIISSVCLITGWYVIFKLCAHWGIWDLAEVSTWRPFVGHKPGSDSFSWAHLPIASVSQVTKHMLHVEGRMSSVGGCFLRCRELTRESIWFNGMWSRAVDDMLSSCDWYKHFFFLSILCPHSSKACLLSWSSQFLTWGDEKRSQMNQVYCVS